MLDVVRLDASGRFTSRTASRSLPWQPGQPVEVTVTGDNVVVAAVPDRDGVIEARHQIAIPAAARAMAGLADRGQVVLVASPERATLLVHP